MDYDDLIARSMEELRLKTEAHDRLWHLSESDWSVDQDRGEIVFSAPNGTIATCPVQIIGTFNTEDSTWLWGWDHPSVQAPLSKHAAVLRDYGVQNVIVELTRRKIRASEEKCWEFTALACKLNDAQGGYRGPAGSALVFMTFGSPTLSGDASNADSRVSNLDEKLADEFSTDIPVDVSDFVIGFLQALYDWEVTAHGKFDRDDEDGCVFAEESHQKLVNEWCVSGFVPQSFSVGSHPSHDPETEKIVSAAVSNDIATVRTQHTDDTGFVSDYEYDLRQEDGWWRVANAFYVDDEGKYEFL